MNVNVADEAVLERLLFRKKRRREIGYEVDLGVVLREILTWANRLVPSQSGSILLDDPILKLDPKKEGRLYFAACFGKGSASLVGTSLPDRWGIAGETYSSGEPYISKDVKKDAKFYAKIDETTGYRTMSVICAPVIIDDATIGVIELINRKGRVKHEKNDLVLLEIFAGYTATLIQNALIARSFEELSKMDHLTGLYNDRYFFHSLEYAIGGVMRQGGDVTIIFFDLDRFKEINDTHGHLAGSTVLKEVSDILKEIFRDAPAVMARYGGDEYVIILSNVSRDEAMEYAEKVRQGIAGYTFLKKRGASGVPPLNIRNVITCSIGVASLSGTVKPGGKIRDMAEALIKAADSAMYRAKDLGKNMVFCAEDKRTPKKSRNAGSDKRVNLL